MLPSPLIIPQDAQDAWPGSCFLTDSGKVVAASQDFVAISNIPIPSPSPCSSIILYSSFQTIQYSLGYSYYYQVAGIVKVRVVSSLAFILFFCIIHVYKLLIMLLAFINSKQGRWSLSSSFANGNEALFLNKRETPSSGFCVFIQDCKRWMDEWMDVTVILF